jgi:hypothetical protein
LANQPSNKFVYFLLPLIGIGLVYGVYELLALRLERGDVYPPYSSLRTDPLGTKALYDGLSGVKGLSVTRNYEPVEKIERASETTLFDLGEYAEEVANASAPLNREWEAYVTQGGRLVVTFVDENEGSGRSKKRVSILKPSPTPVATPGVSPTPRATATALVRVRTLGEKWGFKIGLKPLPQTQDESMGMKHWSTQPVTVIRDPALGKTLPAGLLWHTSFYFKDLDPAWKALYRREGDPVAIERKLGNGILVFFLDSYLVSNEALRDNRYAGLLSYLAGERRRVIFDETHLGVFESPNTATLARKYGLQGLFLGLLLLAVLFIWRATLSLVPPPQAGPTPGEGSGKDFSSGLVNLLRRNIPVGKLLSVCFEEWKKTFAQERSHLASKAAEMERELDGMKGRKGEGSHPVEGYLRMAKILKKRNFKN